MSKWLTIKREDIDISGGELNIWYGSDKDGRNCISIDLWDILGELIENEIISEDNINVEKF